MTRNRRPGGWALVTAFGACAALLAGATTASAAPPSARAVPNDLVPHDAVPHDAVPDDVVAAARSHRFVLDPRGRRIGVVRSAAVSAAAQRAVRVRWTRERMLAARPLDALARTRTTYRGQGAGSSAGPRRVPAAAPALHVAVGLSAGTGRTPRGPGAGTGDRVNKGRIGISAAGSIWPYPSSDVTRTTGKVFFTLHDVATDTDQDYVCSGSAVASTDGSTVLTAGHCVNEGGSGTTDGAFATDWVFVPGYKNGDAPYGTFAATHLATTVGWLTFGNFDHDVAFANVGTNGSGDTLDDAVGGRPIAFDGAHGGRRVILGYPAEGPFNGEWLRYCSGTLFDEPFDPASTDKGLACRMTGGSSGGPWLTDYDPRTGHGTLASVTSYYYPDAPGALYGPYLGSTEHTLYTSVASTTGA